MPSVQISYFIQKKCFIFVGKSRFYPLHNVFFFIKCELCFLLSHSPDVYVHYKPYKPGPNVQLSQMCFSYLFPIQCEAAIRRACVVTDVVSEACVFADAITRVVEAAGASIERARLAQLAAHAHGLLGNTIRTLQPAVSNVNYDRK